MENKKPMVEKSNPSSLFWLSSPELVDSLPQQKNANEIIAEALQSMSIEKRQEAVRQLYGIERASANTSTVPNVGSTPVASMEELEKDPAFVDTKLQEMEQQLKQMKSAFGWNLKVAPLEIAETQNFEYTQSRLFRLKFLRCDRFDASLAAGRFIRYFDWKMELFGEESLARDIILSDLTKKEQATLKKGYMQRLPVRDRAGRAIFCSLLVGQHYDTPESMVRWASFHYCSRRWKLDLHIPTSMFFRPGYASICIR